MLFRGILKLLFLAIFCIFAHASAMLTDRQQQELELFGQELLKLKKIEKNPQLRGFIKKLSKFVQETLDGATEYLKGKGEFTLEKIINLYVEDLLNQLDLNEQDKKQCRALVIDGIENSFLLEEYDDSDSNEPEFDVIKS